MKNLIILFSAIIVCSCNSGADLEAAKKKTADSLALVIKEQRIKDSLANIRANQVADSIAQALTDAINGVK